MFLAADRRSHSESRTSFTSLRDAPTSTSQIRTTEDSATAPNRGSWLLFVTDHYQNNHSSAPLVVNRSSSIISSRVASSSDFQDSLRSLAEKTCSTCTQRNFVYIQVLWWVIENQNLVCTSTYSLKPIELDQLLLQLRPVILLTNSTGALLLESAPSISKMLSVASHNVYNTSHAMASFKKA